MSRGYTHYLSAILRNMITPEPGEMDSLVERLRLGEPVGHAIMFAHLRLAFNYATKYEFHNGDELFSVVIEAIFYAIDKFPQAAIDREARGELRSNNIKAYIMHWVKKFIQDFIAQSKMVPVPAPTTSATGVQAPKVGDISGVNDPHVIDHNVGELIVKETISKIAHDNIDRKILELRLEEKSDYEIADIMGYSQGFIQKRRAQMGVRYNGRQDHA